MGLGKAQLSFTVLEPQKVVEGRWPRWAVVGRSNVGKSSFLNALIHPQVMFRTSRTPGKTTGLVAATLRLGKDENSTLEIVDVPGFGHEKQTDFESERWSELVTVLKERSHTRGILWVWLVDPTRQPGEEDYQLQQWLGRESIAFVFTKADRVKKQERAHSEKLWKDCIQGASEGPYWLSSLKGEGFDTMGKVARNFVRAHAR